jgi:spore germination cell wall hydrolase CwlJ-like protein
MTKHTKRAKLTYQELVDLFVVEDSKEAAKRMGWFIPPDPTRLLSEQLTEVLLAMLLFGEARGESRQAIRAVAQVAVNRARFPHTVFGSRPYGSFEDNLRLVILQPKQFSCFLPGDPNYPKVLRPLQYEEAWVWRMCLDIARDAIRDHRGADAVTANSDHYFDDSLPRPNWADPARQTVEIGRLRFFRLYLPSPTADAGNPSQEIADAQAPREEPAPEAAAALPSLLPNTPPRAARRAAPALLRIREGVSPQHRRSSAGSGPHVSAPASHHLSQRTPRLGARWSLWSRGLSSPYSGLGIALIRAASVNERAPRGNVARRGFRESGFPSARSLAVAARIVPDCGSRVTAF